MRPGEAPTCWPHRPFASTLSPHRFRRLTEARHSYHSRSASHAPQPFLYLLFPYAIMPSPDACEQCVATLSRNEQKNARHDGTMARWHDGTMARWADSKAVHRPCPFSRKNGRQPAPAPKTKPLYPPGIRWQHPKWDPRPTKKTQRRRLEKSLGRDSKPPESQPPYNRQQPPRQRSSKVARAP